MKEITDAALAELRASLSVCNPLVQSLVRRLERVEKDAAEAYAKGQRDTVAAVKVILNGIDSEEQDCGGWWETSTGAAFGAEKLARIIALPIKERP